MHNRWEPAGLIKEASLTLQWLCSGCLHGPPTPSISLGWFGTCTSWFPYRTPSERSPCLSHPPDWLRGWLLRGTWKVHPGISILSFYMLSLQLLGRRVVLKGAIAAESNTAACYSGCIIKFGFAQHEWAGDHFWSLDAWSFQSSSNCQGSTELHKCVFFCMHFVHTLNKYIC